MDSDSINNAVSKMLESMKAVIGEKWPEVKDFAASEARKYVNNLAELAEMKVQNKISEDQARALTRIHERSMTMVLTALEGISLVLVEKAINAGIDTVRGTINKAIGFELL